MNLGQKAFIEGNQAIGLGAAVADCQAYFGYPLTPQNEIIEWFAREYPGMGRTFVQAQSELGAINMVYGAAASGVRAMTSTSGPGWSLMQETMSDMANGELPCVVVNVQRGGPGGGPIRHAQQDYFQCTRGGGHGDYRNIVLVPASTQECFDMMQLGFYLADKYRNPVVVMSDAIIGRLREVVDVKKLEYGPLPGKEWAATGKGSHADGKRRIVDHLGELVNRFPNYRSLLRMLDQKIKLMQSSEVRYENYQAEDAKIILVAYGYTSRVAKESIDNARAEGIKVGMIRPLAVWPFPNEIIHKKAQAGCKFLVVEDCIGQMIEDVVAAVGGLSSVQLLNIFDRHLPTDGGMILPAAVYNRIKQIQQESQV